MYLTILSTDQMTPSYKKSIRDSRMFYRNKHGRRIHIANPHRPLNLSRGGFIPAIAGSEKHPNEDTISSYLEEGSLVVPVKAVKHLSDYKGKFTGAVQTNPDKLIKAITMPHEVVVNRQHASKVEAHLRKKGIRLPLGS